MEDDIASEAGPQDKDTLFDLENGGTEPLGDSDLNEDVAKLRTLWRNEVSAPELLKVDEHLVSDLIQQVENQQEIVDDARASPEEAFSASLYQMELDRLRYSLSKYLRTRLRKVERDALHVLSTVDGEMQGRLSDREREHAKGYVDMLEDHFTRTCLSQMPSNFRSLTNTSQEENMVQEPNLDTFVVCRARDDVGLVQIGEAAGREESSMDLRQGDMFIVRYRPIRTLVLGGRVDLI
ncbi:unnamed protein product [Ectocarpus sp. 12 AP-2014]